MVVGGGPVNFDEISAAYPGITIIRDIFSDKLPIPRNHFDAIYSISVLEHVNLNDLTSICNGLSCFLKTSGYSIHSVDYPLRGAGSIKNLEHLNYIERELCKIDETTQVELLKYAQDIDAMEMPAFNYAYSFNNAKSNEKPVWQRWGAFNLCGIQRII